MNQATIDTIRAALQRERKNAQELIFIAADREAALATIDVALAELQQPAEYTPMEGYITFRLANGELKVMDAHSLDGLPFPDDVAVCRRVPTPALDAPSYSHRNGETTPPTEVGEFWFKGWVRGYPVAEKVVVMRRANRGLCVIGVEASSFIEDFDGQWWGPIVVVTPWKEG